MISNGVISALQGYKVVTIPTVSQTSFTYNGTEQTLTITGLDTAYVTATNISATNAGDYIATFSLKNNQSSGWEDGTTADKTVNWSIAKAQGSISLSPNSISLTTSTTTATVAVSWTGDGAVSLASGNTSYATVSPTTLSVAGHVTVTATGTGSTTVTATLADGNNYLGATATCAVDVSLVPLKTFAAATDAEIAQMVAAADAGQIDLYEDCGWRVGQEHTTHVSAIASSGTYDGVSWSVGESQPEQDVTLVLMHQGLYQLVTPVKDKQGNNRSTCSFVVGMKDCFSQNGYMNSTNTNSGSWRDSARRGWCNGGFRQAMETVFGTSIFKQFQCITGTYSNESSSGNENIISLDYFALFAGKEIFGGGSSVSGSTDNEANALTRITWYETTSNRNKTRSDSGATWWERSPHYFTSNYFCSVGVSGSVGSNVASAARSLSPFGCM